MIGKYLIVNKSIVPDYFEKVLEARNLLEQGKVKNVSEAAKKVGISRSTYYKYKDYIFLPSDQTSGGKALISMMLKHKRGILSEVLNYLSSVNGNILTINQNIPINNSASVAISLDTSDLTVSIDEVVSCLGDMDNVIFSKLLAME